MIPVALPLPPDPEPTLANFVPCPLYAEDGLPTSFVAQFKEPSPFADGSVTITLPVLPDEFNPRPFITEPRGVVLSHFDDQEVAAIEYRGIEPYRLTIVVPRGVGLEAHVSNLGADLYQRLGQFWVPIAALLQAGMSGNLESPVSVRFAEHSHLFSFLLQLLPTEADAKDGHQILQAWDAAITAHVPTHRPNGRVLTKNDLASFQAEVVPLLRRSVAVAHHYFQ